MTPKPGLIIGIALLHLTLLNLVSLHEPTHHHLGSDTLLVSMALPVPPQPTLPQPASPTQPHPTPKIKQAPKPSAHPPAAPSKSIPSVAASSPQVPASSAAGLPFSADGIPGAIKLVYKVDSNKFPYTLQGELLWQPYHDRYQARLSFGMMGLTRTQTSRGKIGHNGLEPERFSDKFRSEVAAHFNYERGLVTFSANTPDVQFQPGAQDRLSVLIQIAALVATQSHRFTPGTALSIQTVGPRAADTWQFVFGDMELLQLPNGPMQGLKLIRQPEQLYDQKVEIWMAPSLGYLPARIRLTEHNGDYIDQQWVASEVPESGSTPPEGQRQP